MFLKKSKKEIVFINTMTFYLDSKPVLAHTMLPDWYKKTDSYIPNVKTQSSERTIKRCMPVFDAMVAGYIINTPCDIEVIQKDGEPQYYSSMRDLVQYHPQKQASFHPSAHPFQFPKFINGWGIKTPKGYSCLFIAPMHNPNPYFEVFPGLVDTDGYTAPVNFPFVLKNPLFEGIIPAGTPMVQVIPFKRDEWKFGTGSKEDIEQSLDVDRHLHMFMFDRYKTLWRRTKNWNVKN